MLILQERYIWLIVNRLLLPNNKEYMVELDYFSVNRQQKEQKIKK